MTAFTGASSWACPVWHLRTSAGWLLCLRMLQNQGIAGQGRPAPFTSGVLRPSGGKLGAGSHEKSDFSLQWWWWRRDFWDLDQVEISNRPSSHGSTFHPTFPATQLNGICFYLNYNVKINVYEVEWKIEPCKLGFKFMINFQRSGG